MGTRAGGRAALVAVAVLLSSLAGAPPAGAELPDVKVVRLDAWPVEGECRAQVVARSELAVVYAVNGSWRPDDAPYEGAVTCLVNGQVAAVPIWLPTPLLPMSPFFPIVPYGLAAGTAVVTGDELTLCVRVEWDLWGSGRQVDQHCE